MSTVIDTIERAQLRRVPEFRAGDRLRVHFIVIEGTRRRTQVFEGVAIKRQGQGVRETFTVRKQSFGVGVERTFPLHSPKIERIEVAARGDVRRAKLYYLRERVGKAARVRERGYVGPEETIQPGLVHAAAQGDEAEAQAQTDPETQGSEYAELDAEPTADVGETGEAEETVEAVEAEVAAPPDESAAPEEVAEEPAGAAEAPEAVGDATDDGAQAEDEQPSGSAAADDDAKAESSEDAGGEPATDSPDQPA